ncbi:hypothetical protein [Salinimonas chungwhensis]|uniref:hypothetical protein n=1 Tax=Salinimonas chungwhensis TaxID=265425 RepID=UPI000376E544|nr:hypothetical protein [Salinimonas chungwhensis]
MKKIKVKILGTSNGIINGGYANHLANHAGIEVLQNLSIGSSHPTVIAHALSRNDPGKNEDFLILDVCVNEQRALSKNRYDQSISEHMFLYYLSHCEKYQTRPFVLLLPVMGKKNAFLTEALAHWKALCHKYFVAYLDVAMLAGQHDNLKTLWKDANHPSIDFSQDIASSIVESLTELDSGSSSSTGPLQTRSFDLIELAGGAPVDRKTKLLRVGFQAYKEGETFIIRGRSDFRLLGFSLDMAHTHAALKLVGDNEVYQRFDNNFYDETKALRYVSWSILAPVYSKSCQVEVTVIKPVKSRQYMLNDHTAVEPADRNVIAELESALILYV